MINWTTDENCRRCHQSLGLSSNVTGADASPNRFYLYLIIFIAALTIPVLVSFVNPLFGDHLGMFFVIAAIGLIASFKFLIIYEMFKVSLWWAFCGIFFAPISTLLFIINYWERAKGKVILNFSAALYCVIMVVVVGRFTGPKIAQNTAAPQATPSTMKYLDATPTPKPDFLEPRKDLLKKK